MKISNTAKKEQLNQSGIRIGRELYLPEGIGFARKNITNEKLTVLCSQLNIKQPIVLGYRIPNEHERLTSEIEVKNIRKKH